MWAAATQSPLAVSTRPILARRVPSPMFCPGTTPNPPIGAPEKGYTENRVAYKKSSHHTAGAWRDTPDERGEARGLGTLRSLLAPPHLRRLWPLLDSSACLDQLRVAPRSAPCPGRPPASTSGPCAVLTCCWTTGVCLAHRTGPVTVRFIPAAVCDHKRTTTVVEETDKRSSVRRSPRSFHEKVVSAQTITDSGPKPSRKMTAKALAERPNQSTRYGPMRGNQDWID